MVFGISYAGIFIVTDGAEAWNKAEGKRGAAKLRKAGG